MSAGITYPRFYAEEEEDFYDEPEIVFDNNLHGQAVESFQTGRFFRNYNEEPARPGFTNTFRPDRQFTENYSYTLPARTMTDDVAGEW